MIGLVVWLAGLPYQGPIRHLPCETHQRVTTAYDRDVSGRPVRVAVDETSDKGKRWTP